MAAATAERIARKQDPQRQKATERSIGANASRNAHRMVSRFNLAWNIPLSQMTYKAGSESFSLPYHAPIDVFKFFMQKHPEVLCGGFKEDTDCMNLLASFWKIYREHHPGHAIFTELPADALPTAVPVMLYGDEGRGRRRGNTTVCSVEPMFGLSTAVKARELKRCVDGSCQCQPAEGTKRKYEQLEPLDNIAALDPISFATPTLKEHSYLSRIPLFVVPCTLYKDYTDMIDYMLDKISKDMSELFELGVLLNNRRWRMIFLGMKGDQKWHAAIAHLNRFYSTKGKVQPQAMCPECLAGLQQCPYEDVSDVPKWESTIFKRRPWDENNKPCLTNIPFDATKPEKFLLRDHFHIMKMGVFRHYVASVIATLVSWRYFTEHGEPNRVENQLVRLHGSFWLWCNYSQKSAALRSFTKALMMWGKSTDFPYMNTKGSDTTLLMQWLCDILPGIINQSRHDDHAKAFKLMLEVGRAGLACSDSLYKHFLFYDRSCAMSFLDNGNRFLFGYARLAKEMLPKPFSAFAMIPKVHAMKHFMVEFRSFLQSSRRLILSPLASGCEVNEDLIGRLCRLSRRVDPRTMQTRVLQLYCIKAKITHKKVMKKLGL